eukprot:PITA_15982
MGIWLIDSDASRHFTSYKEVLHNLVEKETNLEIVLGDDIKYPVKGVGNVSLELNQGNTIHLQDVLYVPDLKKNLVGGSPLGVMSCDTTVQSELWHRRLAHLHYKALPDVRQMVIWMPKFQVEKEGVCLGCAEGKLKRGPFPSNDYSRKTWIYFLKKKDGEFSWFQHFKALIENQTEKKIKILRTDHGTEYESNEFHDFCKEAGIKRETTTPYAPEQNGVAERKNRTIMEVISTMLHDQRLLKFLWDEAVNTIVYVQN